jgi:hypothetical protein
MKFNRGVALGTSLVLILAACGGSSSSSRSRNSVAQYCFESVDALTLAVKPFFDTYNEGIAFLSQVENDLKAVTADHDAMRADVPQELTEAEKAWEALDKAGLDKSLKKQMDDLYLLAFKKESLARNGGGDFETLRKEADTLLGQYQEKSSEYMVEYLRTKTALDRYNSLLTKRADETTASWNRVLVAQANLKTVTDALTTSRAAYEEYETATVCAVLGTGDSEFSAEESSTSTTRATYQFEEDPIDPTGTVPAISGGDSEGPVEEASTSSSPKFQFNDEPFIKLLPLPPVILRSADGENTSRPTSPPTTAFVRPMFIFEEDGPIPSLEEVKIPTVPALPEKSIPTVPEVQPTIPQIISNITIPNNIINNINQNINSNIVLIQNYITNYDEKLIYIIKNDDTLINIINNYVITNKIILTNNIQNIEIDKFIKNYTIQNKNILNNTIPTNTVEENVNPNKIIPPYCYVDNKQIPIQIITIPTNIPVTIPTLNENNIIPITNLDMTISNENQLVTIIQVPNKNRKSIIDSKSTTSTIAASSPEQNGRAVYVAVAGFDSSTPVTVSVAESNTSIATFETDKNGQASAQIVIPDSVQTSSVHLVVSGNNDKQQSVVMPVPLALALKKSSTPTKKSDVSTTSSTLSAGDTAVNNSVAPSGTTVTAPMESSSSNRMIWLWLLLFILVVFAGAYRYFSRKK